MNAPSLSIPFALQTVLLLIASNVFMTMAWYGHLKNLASAPWLVVFVPFAVLYLREPLKLDYLWAALCMVGAVYFIFRNS